MKRVATAESLALIGHYRNALEQEGIACTVKNELLAGALGDVPFLECLPELWVVRDADAPRAERLLEELRSPAVAGPPWRCTQCNEDNDAGFAACWSCGAVDEVSHRGKIMTAPATAAVLIIGNEILSGKTQDANLQFLALEFARLGIRLDEARVIRDEPEVIAAVVNELRARHTYVFTTGGIGPTHDDLTAESIARAFDLPLVIDEEARRRIASGGRELNAARLKMAMIPRGASLIDNSVSLAPGFRIGNVFVLAGVPSIARAMFAACEHELRGGSPILSESVDVWQREGDFAATLDAIARRYPEVEIGSYPFAREGRYGASLVVRGTDGLRVGAAIAEIRAALLPGA